MKRSTAFVLVFVCMLLLGGCKNADVPNSDQTKSDDPLILVRSNDETSKPYENLLWQQQWSGRGWLSADAASISLTLSEVCNELPQITYGDDFEIRCGDGVEFLSVSVYSSDFDRIHHNVSADVLKDLAGGTYYLVITVKSQGKYVAAQGEYEYSGYECACKMIVV